MVGVACTPDEPEPIPTASASPTASAPSSGPTTAQKVRIYLKTPNDMDCEDVEAVEREVDGEPTLEKAMTELLAGPTVEEKARGLQGWFTETTKDMLISARIEGDTGRVDFKDLREVIPNASSSCGSAILLSQLNATVKEFGVSKTLYSINGSTTDFYEWLQMVTPDA